MGNRIIFDESSWCYVESLLPDDVKVRKVVLEDFMWFMGRPLKYKSNKEKIDDYIRHLKLKANPRFEAYNSYLELFKMVDVFKIKEKLIGSLIQ